MTEYLPLLAPIIALIALLILPSIIRHNRETAEANQRKLLQQLAAHQQDQLNKLQDFTRNELTRQQQTLTLRQDHSDATLRNELSTQIAHQNEHLHRELNHLANITETRLIQIGEHVNQRLNQTAGNHQDTLNDIIARLSRIDEAQKRLDQLASDITGLRDILADKRSRGAFGESQLKTLIDNILPAQHVRYQATLSNGRRPDCLLQLPAPTGQIAIDAKFPLDSYRQITNEQGQRDPTAARQFKQDIKKHIDDIANKYILPPETATGAIMFIPAEAVFAELHAHHGDLVEYAQHQNVWLTSPTTLAAVLTTARAVIKDDATRQQAHILREQLYHLHREFQQFQTRMDTLARHIDQAQKDAQDIHQSAREITTRFRTIDQQPIPEND